MPDKHKPSVRSLTRELEQQKRVNERLRRENLRLRKRLAEQERPQGGPETPPDDLDRRVGLIRQQTFIRYLTTLFNSSSAYRFLTRIWNVLRKLRILRAVISVFAVILASTFLLTLLLSALPFLIAVILLTLVATVLSVRRMNRLMRRRLLGKRLVVLVPPPECSFRPGSFFVGSTLELANREDTAVLVVSPFHLLTRGLSGRKPYLTARQDGYDLYMVRPLYFYALRKFVMQKSDADQIYIF